MLAAAGSEAMWQPPKVDGWLMSHRLSLIDRCHTILFTLPIHLAQNCLLLLSATEYFPIHLPLVGGCHQ
jgi:hypothetical protein